MAGAPRQPGWHSCKTLGKWQQEGWSPQRFSIPALPAQQAPANSPRRLVAACQAVSARVHVVFMHIVLCAPGGSQGSKHVFRVVCKLQMKSLHEKRIRQWLGRRRMS